MTTLAELLRAVKSTILIDGCAETAFTAPLESISDPRTADYQRLTRQSAERAAKNALEALHFLITDPIPQEGASESRFTLAGKTLMIAQQSLDDNRIWLAGELIRHAIRHLMPLDACIPATSDSGLQNPAYRHSTTGHTRLLFACYSILMECFLATKDYLLTLNWFEEMQSILYHSRSTSSPSLYDWQHCQSPEPLLTAELFDCLVKSATACKQLDNTASYHYSMMLADRYGQSLPKSDGRNGLLGKEWRDAIDGLLLCRHPDPQLDFRFELKDPRLQVCAAWKRLPLKINENMGRRSFCSAFIWKGYMYIAGGTAQGDREDREPSDPRDIWRARLDPLGKWEFFSKYPRMKKDDKKMLDPSLRIYNGKAYLFTGDPILDILDLDTGKWTQVKTTFKATAADRNRGLPSNWPYPGNSILGASMQIVGDRLLVFGGIHLMALVGCDLLMELNLKTLRWRRLSGMLLPQAQNDPNVPGPRFSAASWVDQGKCFILYGSCERSRPGFGFETNVGPPETWSWNDMWSWDIEGERWRRERIAGNPPAPRSEMGYVYNQKIGKVVIFGGVNHMCHSRIIDTKGVFAANILADAFLLDTTAHPDSSSGEAPANQGTEHTTKRSGLPGAYSWKQIMACGFPTYRVKPALVCDPDTGKTYLYGGQVRSELIPSRKQTEAQAVEQGKYTTKVFRALAERPGGAGQLYDLAERQTSRHFGHVWQLHLDIPGGYFESIDKEEEMRTAPAGPWDRCFECGKTGFWRQCGGSCGGKAHFCGRECQIKGWKLHREMHSCRKA